MANSIETCRTDPLDEPVQRRSHCGSEPNCVRSRPISCTPDLRKGRPTMQRKSEIYRNMKLTATGIALAVLGGVAAAQPAAAYQCKHLVVRSSSSVIHHKAGSQSWARNNAVQGWSRRAKSSFGLAWSVWAIAKNASVSCNKTGSIWRCKAKGKPCKYVVN